MVDRSQELCFNEHPIQRRYVDWRHGRSFILVSRDADLDMPPQDLEAAKFLVGLLQGNTP